MPSGAAKRGTLHDPLQLGEHRRTLRAAGKARRDPRGRSRVHDGGTIGHLHPRSNAHVTSHPERVEALVFRLWATASTPWSSGVWQEGASAADEVIKAYV
ncbi:Hypothetical protein A7982_08020 [Minicystis rosea]|nr:Hypothetical protein A7982_08020 [Minicystis rosea]